MQHLHLKCHWLNYNFKVFACRPHISRANKPVLAAQKAIKVFSTFRRMHRTHPNTQTNRRLWHMVCVLCVLCVFLLSLLPLPLHFLLLSGYAIFVVAVFVARRLLFVALVLWSRFVLQQTMQHAKDKKTKKRKLCGRKMLLTQCNPGSDFTLAAPAVGQQKMHSHAASAPAKF